MGRAKLWISPWIKKLLYQVSLFPTLAILGPQWSDHHHLDIIICKDAFIALTFVFAKLICVTCLLSYYAAVFAISSVAANCVVLFKWIKRGILDHLWWYDEFPVSNIPAKDGENDKQSAYHNINSTSSYVCEGSELINKSPNSEYLDNGIDTILYAWTTKRPFPGRWL